MTDSLQKVWRDRIASTPYSPRDAFTEGGLVFRRRNGPRAVRGAHPGMRKGDMVEAKDYAFNKLLSESWSTALEGLAVQIEKQNRAIETEGLGRHILYCFDGKIAASKVRKRYGEDYKNSRFLDCRPYHGS